MKVFSQPAAASDELSQPDAEFGRVALLVGGGVAAAVAAGLVGLGLSYLTERISQGIIFDLREQLFERLLGQSVSFSPKTARAPLCRESATTSTRSTP